jgi:hypothetical protein
MSTIPVCKEAKEAARTIYDLFAMTVREEGALDSDAWTTVEEIIQFYIDKAIGIAFEAKPSPDFFEQDVNP